VEQVKTVAVVPVLAFAIVIPIATTSPATSSEPAPEGHDVELSDRIELGASARPRVELNPNWADLKVSLKKRKTEEPTGNA